MQNRPRTVGFKPNERNVFLHILTACNLACRHCYINKKEHGTGQLSREQLREWLELFANTEKKTNLILLGGEPTLHPELPYAIEVAKKLGYSVTVDSNGYLFHDFLERTSPQLLDYLSFSLDGPNPAINDAIRGNGVFQVCTDNIKRAISYGYRVSLIYTVNSKNLYHLEKMLPLLTGLGVKKFFIQVIGMRGNSATADHQEIGQVSRKEWLAVVPKVAKEIAAQHIHVIYPKVFLDADEIFACGGIVAENYFVFPNGRVYMCPLCEDHPIHAYEIQAGRLVPHEGLTEKRFFDLNIAEGCVMNKLLQPEILEYNERGEVLHPISCCLLKQEIGS
jgi:MoaA/NifB/PqqE/SkfB family radical SAM enzyme